MHFKYKQFCRTFSSFFFNLQSDVHISLPYFTKSVWPHVLLSLLFWRWTVSLVTKIVDTFYCLFQCLTAAHFVWHTARNIKGPLFQHKFTKVSKMFAHTSTGNACCFTIVTRRFRRTWRTTNTLIVDCRLPTARSVTHTTGWNRRCPTSVRNTAFVMA